MNAGARQLAVGINVHALSQRPHLHGKILLLSAKSRTIPDTPTQKGGGSSYRLDASIQDSYRDFCATHVARITFDTAPVPPTLLKVSNLAYCALGRHGL